MKMDAERDPLIREKFAELQDVYDRDTPAMLYLAVADYFDLMQDSARAEAAFERAIDLAPDSPKPRFHCARWLMKQGRYRDGGKQLEICSEIDSVALAGRRFTDNNLYYLAYALFHVDRYKEAAEAFRGAGNLINIWGDPLVLKRFHLHQGYCWHLEGHYLDAAESYRRALIAPGPGDSCDEDEMDEDTVEASQDYNAIIEPYLEMAEQGIPLERKNLEVTPAFP